MDASNYLCIINSCYSRWRQLMRVLRWW